MELIPKSSLVEQRRAIFERVSSRYASNGMILDDPIYLRLMEAWIAGEIEMEEAAAHWNSVRRSSIAERRASLPDIDDAGDRMSSDLLAMIESEVKKVGNAF
ncbi:hypothetical protein PY650_23700 [Rhizobium calliandrae]|uniref:Antitoxin VbhA domain-containing protein n=1 Tax=Rhizobium calliandrae TaxID=1312182 RepID=A0ABT7KJ10_9HYPH|nr:hypothetical protein [Rhizobium calliandrae]MDL2408595.1 hypothetical protein [Rhizobium calliandrae]